MIFQILKTCSEGLYSCDVGPKEANTCCQTQISQLKDKIKDARNSSRGPHNTPGVAPESGRYQWGLLTFVLSLIQV